MDNLPSEIIFCILSRVPIPTIGSCKLVCKRWLEILSAPVFAKYHLSQSKLGLLVHEFVREDPCKLFELEDVLELQNGDLHCNLVKKFDTKSFIPADGETMVIEGSVNGFLLLRDYITLPDSLYICNPITREYIALPQPELIVEEAVNRHHGFGLSSKSGQYKVVWINCQGRRFCSQGKSDECMVYTLGTGCSWRSVAPASPIDIVYGRSGVFLNGNLHWLVEDINGKHLISCYDVETEIFLPSSQLPPVPGILPKHRSLVILQESLCLCEYGSWDTLVVWTMKDYQVTESWSQLYVIDIMDRTFHETLSPLKVFKNGDMLMKGSWDLLLYCNKSKSTRNLKLVHCSGLTNSVLHTSTLVSLESFLVENVRTF